MQRTLKPYANRILLFGGVPQRSPNQPQPVVAALQQVYQQFFNAIEAVVLVAQHLRDRLPVLSVPIAEHQEGALCGLSVERLEIVSDGRRLPESGEQRRTVRNLFAEGIDGANLQA